MLVQLEGGLQTYDWGKLGSESAAARYAAATDKALRVDADTPYAELWMGTHPKLPAKVVGGGAAGAAGGDLRKLVAADDAAIGAKVVAKFGGGELPYLFKVLSIRKALSIQAHPDKALAKKLHARDPEHYPDDNHKPEMTIALTDFDGFCGFRPPAEIAEFVETVPEFAALLGDAGAKFVAEVKGGDAADAKSKETLRALVQAVMTHPDAEIEKQAAALVERAQREGAKFGGSAGGDELAKLLVRLNGQFPNDIGLFSGGLMLNYVKLNKGEAMFLRAKDPHAYLSGDIIECMAASDNVVRSGFTPKFKDVPTLVSMLTCESGSVEDQKMNSSDFAKSSGGTARLFDPPIDEFAVLQQSTPAGATATLQPLTGGSIFIVTEGEGTLHTTGADKTELKYVTGSIFFAGAGTGFELVADKPTVSYHALCEV